MKDSFNLRHLIIAFSILLFSFTSVSSQTWEYLGQTLPGSVPERFVKAPFLATSQWFWHGTPSFSPDGTEMFFVKYQTDVNKTEIWFSSHINGAWTPPQRAPFSGGGYSDNNPKFFGSRDTLFFQSERPESAIYRVIRYQNIWSAPAKLNLPIPAGKSLGKQFSMAESGNIYGELDNYQGTAMDLYYWPFVNGEFQRAIRLANLCSSAADAFPTIDVNEQFLVFGSNRTGGSGYFDLYLSYKNPDGSWNQPVNLGNRFNSGTEEAWSYFSPDGAWFFYTTNRAGDQGFNPYWVNAQVIYDLIPKKPYMGQLTPGMTPEIFAPDLVSSSSLREFSLTLSSDSTDVFFYRFGDTTPSKVYNSRFEKGSWTTPEVFAPAADHPAAEPCLTPDNHRLYFMWDTGADLHPYYMTERGRTGWTAPVLAGDGMYMTSSSDGQLYTTDISALFSTGRTYLAKIETTRGLFSRLNRIDIQPHYGTQAHPCIAPDGSYMIFDIEGGRYLFVSFRKEDGSWDTAIDLTEHGFSRDAGGAYVSPDGKYLFFHQDGDIWWVDIKVIEDLNPFTTGTCSLEKPGIELYQNSPNPCSTNTSFGFQLEKPGCISIDLFSITGAKIAILLDNQPFSSGKHEVSTNLPSLSPGIYSYALSTDEGLLVSRKLVIER